MEIFLSHSTQDRAIADALASLLSQLFGSRLKVDYSSDQKAGGGIPPGAQWLPWIEQRIKGASKTYVLLTPNSTRKPWVLWESGAAAGVVLARDRKAVVPITFGISDEDIPSPFQNTQRVRGDTQEDGGIHRLLQDLNHALKSPLTGDVFKMATEKALPGFFDSVRGALKDGAPADALLASVPHAFSAQQLGGLWVTCYQFTNSGGKTRSHAEITQMTPRSDRYLTGVTHGPAPRTEGRKNAFRNRIEAELANRHVIGHWKNVSDNRYFGVIHVSVLTGENVMQGYYTSLHNDVSVGSGPWKWVRIAPDSIGKVDLSRMTLREPVTIKTLLARHSDDDGPLQLDKVTRPV